MRIKRENLHKQSLIHQNYLHSLLCFNKGTKRMKVSMLLLSNSFLTVQHTKLRTPLETSARFLSTIILTQTVSYFDSSSKWTISKMLYCYFNPVLLIFFLCLAFFLHSVFSHCVEHCSEMRAPTLFLLNRDDRLWGLNYRWIWSSCCVRIF